MPVGSHKPSTHNSQKKDAFVTTTGEIFSDGVIDLVSSADPCRPKLIAWDGHHLRIAPRIRRGRLWYQAPELHRSVGKGVIHKNTAARRLSRLSTRIKAL